MTEQDQGHRDTPLEPVQREPVQREPVQREPGPLEPAQVHELLAGLDDRPVEEHVAVYDQVHRRLRDHLDATSDVD